MSMQDGFENNPTSVVKMEPQEDVGLKGFVLPRPLKGQETGPPTKATHPVLPHTGEEKGREEDNEEDDDEEEFDTMRGRFFDKDDTEDDEENMDSVIHALAGMRSQVASCLTHHISEYRHYHIFSKHSRESNS